MSNLNNIKYLIKRHISPRYLEVFSHKAVLITKIPKEESTISDLFVLRIEQNWETSFECLQLNNLINPENKIKRMKVVFFFFSKKGRHLGEYKFILPKKIKTTISVGNLAKKIKKKKDSLFAVYHPKINFGSTNYKSYLTERGYIGYGNLNKGSIKGFVHGNLDAIAKSKKSNKYQLLGNYSFFKKKYILQYSLNPNFVYEFYLVNSTNVIQKFKMIEISSSSKNKTILNVPPGGFFKHVKSVDKKGLKTNLIIESRLYLARPVVFKLMNSSFDVFHG